MICPRCAAAGFVGVEETEDEHVERIERVVADARGSSRDDETQRERRQVHAEEMPWNHPARTHREWIVGYGGNDPPRDVT